MYLHMIAQMLNLLFKARKSFGMYLIDALLNLEDQRVQLKLFGHEQDYEANRICIKIT